MSTPERLTDPVHQFLFDEISGPKILDQITGLYVDVDQYIPVQGHLRGAMRFGKGARLAKLPPLIDLPPPWSLALWIRREADSPASTLLSSERFGLKVEQWGSTSMLGITQYGVRDWQSAASVPLGTWCQLVVVGSLAETLFYLNGVHAGSIASSMPLPRKWLGSSGGWTEFLQASIENVRIYEQSLTANQIRALHTERSEQTPAMTIRLASGVTLPADGAVMLGKIAAGRTTKAELLLENHGEKPLFFTPTLEDHSHQFSLSLPRSRAIEPGAATTVSVAFRAKYNGLAEAVLTLESNDPKQDKSVLLLSAIGDVPAELPAIKLLLDRTPIAPGEKRWLGRVPVGTRKVFPVSICNTGTAVLRIQLVAKGLGTGFAFWQGPRSFDVAPGSEFCADLAFTPQTALPAQAEVTIQSNDPDNPTYGFFVYGCGELARQVLIISATGPDETPIPIGDQSLVFGRALLGQTIQQMLCLCNGGSGVVTLREPPKLLETSDESFQVERPASLIIPLGASMALPITFCSPTEGDKTGRLRIVWDGGISDLKLFAQAEQ